MFFYIFSDKVKQNSKRKSGTDDIICIRYPPDIYPHAIGVYRESKLRFLFFEDAITSLLLFYDDCLPYASSCQKLVGSKNFLCPRTDGRNWNLNNKWKYFPTKTLWPSFLVRLIELYIVQSNIAGFFTFTSTNY